MSTLTSLGHSSFKVTTPSGKIVLIDPWLKENPTLPETERTQEKVDLVLVTHGHDDHFDKELHALAKATGAKVVAQDQVTQRLWMQGHENLVFINYGGNVTVDEEIRVTMTLAFHAASIAQDDGMPGMFHNACGFVLHLPDARIYFAGDTALFGDMALIGQLYAPTHAVLPIGDTYTMGPLEAAHALRLLGSQNAIPCHYGTLPELVQTPDAFIAHAAKLAPAARVHVLKPGGMMKL